jgi:hypothetical protein
MNIDFSAIDKAVEKVIAKHDAMFKFDMAIKRLEREQWPFPANFALAANASAAIAGEYNSRIQAISKSLPKHGDIVTL